MGEGLVGGNVEFNCSRVRQSLTTYLGGEMNWWSRLRLRAHLRDCQDCFEEYERADTVRRALSHLAVPEASPQLRVRILSAVSTVPFSVVERFQLLRANMLRPLAVPAAGGFVAAVLLVGGLLANFSLIPRNFAQDVPLTYLAKSIVADPELVAPSPFPISHDFVVEAFIDGSGNVYDFRVIEGPVVEPEPAGHVVHELANRLLTTRFEPATSFGRPVRGRLIVSFGPSTSVTVRG